MNFAVLALIGLIALAGPLIALRRSWHLPMLIGELAAGVVFGVSGFRLLHPSDPTFTFLADIGFALVMFVAGSHVPVRDAAVRAALAAGAVRLLLVAVAAAVLGIAIAVALHSAHAPVYIVLLASSSAACVLPIVDSLALTGPQVLRMTAQVALADALCIVALPLVIAPSNAGIAALGAAAIAVCAVLLFFVFRWADRRGWRKALQRASKAGGFALELRIDLIVLFALAALAVATHVSIMLAGFALGLVVAAIGEPRRLTRQVFGIAEGFFAPLFFVWLGASLNLTALVDSPSDIVLALALGFGAIVAHLVSRLLGEPVPLALLSSAQLGIPVAAATIGLQQRIFTPGEAAAVVLGALLTIVVSAGGGAIAARRQPAATPSARAR